MNEIDRDVVKTTPEIKGDWRPVVFLLTDGHPTDSTAAATRRWNTSFRNRANLVAVAQAGIAVGMQGADLGLEAATGALKSVFNGNSEEFGKEMEARGKQIEADAMKICDALPPLLASQQALAAALPAFQPYATMDQTDIDDCRHDGDYDFNQVGANASVHAERDTDSGHATDAAAEADAAAARPQD